MVECSQCHKALDPKTRAKCVASISGSISGDEYTESFYFCDDCQVYTVEIYHDRFLGEGEVSVRGPVAKAEGDAKVRLIRACATPWDKKCRCQFHQEYFDGQLD